MKTLNIKKISKFLKYMAKTRKTDKLAKRVLKRKISKFNANYETKLKRLEYLLQVSAALNSIFDIHKLLNLIMKLAQKVTDAEALSLYLVDEEKNYLQSVLALGVNGKIIKTVFKVKIGEGLSGWVAKHKKPVLVKDAQNDKRLLKKYDKKTGFITKSVMAVPMLFKGKLIGVTQALNKKKGKFFTKDDLEIFSAFANQAAIAVTNARLYNIALNEARLRKELEVASTIQKNFLPKQLPESKFFEVASAFFPAQNVGGDLYNFIKFSRKKVGLMIGDVSGKGVPAAIYMSGIMRDFMWFANGQRSPSEIFNNLNKNAIQSSSRGIFVTLLYLLFDLENMRCFYSCAGHIPPILLRDKPYIIEVEAGPPLGIFEDFEYTTGSFEIQHNDIFIAVTDGVTEARNLDKHQFGIKGFANLLYKNSKNTTSPFCLNDLIKTAVASVKNYSKLPIDDITVIGIHIN